MQSYSSRHDGSLAALPRPQALLAALAGLALAGGVGVLAAAVDGRQAALLAVGAALGFALHHALFGFAGAYRRFFTEGRTAGIRAQLLMLAVASMAFAPLLAAGEAFGHGLGGAVAPVGVSVMAGAFLFGIGMQVAGGCASGTLFTFGGGSLRMAAVLAGFVAGSVIGSAHLPWWLDQPRLARYSLFTSFGWPLGLAAQLAFLGLLALGARAWERRRRGTLEPLAWRAHEAPWAHTLFRGGWPLAWGALALALLNLATLLIAGHPWSVTWGFTLWGGQAADALGFGVREWTFWQWPRPAAALDSPVFEDGVSVMNMGIVVGALLAAGIAGRFAPRLRFSPGALAGAVLGGLLLGYGARLAFGCNIGAFFGGVASGSLHGWLWILFALAGTAAAVRLPLPMGLRGQDEPVRGACAP